MYQLIILLFQIEQTVLLKNRIREIVANRDSLQKQLGTPLLSQLSTEEQELLSSLQVTFYDSEVVMFNDLLNNFRFSLI